MPRVLGIEALVVSSPFFLLFILLLKSFYINLIGGVYLIARPLSITRAYFFISSLLGNEVTSPIYIVPYSHTWHFASYSLTCLGFMP